MDIALSVQTQKLLEQEMKRGQFATADDAVRTALQTLAETCGEDYEDLDADTRAAIEQAESQCQRGEGRPWAEVRAELLAGCVDRP